MVFAWNGLMALYIPVGIFFVWLAVMTFYTIKNVNAGAYHHDPQTGDTVDPAGRHCRQQRADECVRTIVRNGRVTYDVKRA
ncbi:hypothetical protein AWC29_26915 [Mycobacterium triplex]|uniref:Uncharacterized protein n=1 Tax=Mycobacterium triplex TaxID=47839 RepID=A0A024K3V8_9MYCO|nr:hypothetical protein [Mycobacterium triplex]ORW99985.1 hypothetical protein AWC29_26915 [Mycobacterium triplex]CDO90183.1 hypothetical protein BN973_04576 [Mycobacterium triplex]